MAPGPQNRSLRRGPGVFQLLFAPQWPQDINELTDCEVAEPFNDSGIGGVIPSSRATICLVSS